MGTSDSPAEPSSPGTPGSHPAPSGLSPGAAWEQLGAGRKPAPVPRACWSQQPQRLPSWTWAGVESLFQTKVCSRRSPAPGKPYQDIQPLVLMAGKVAVCLVDSYHREGGKNNGLVLFPCCSSKRLKRILMGCCRPCILWLDPALPGSAPGCSLPHRRGVFGHRAGSRALPHAVRPRWDLEMPKASQEPGSAVRGLRLGCLHHALRASEKHLVLLGYVLFVGFPPPQASFWPCVQACWEETNKTPSPALSGANA